MADNKNRRAIGAIIVLIGAIVLIAAAFVPWYTQEIKGSVLTYTITINENAFPGLPGSNGTIQYSCSGLPPILSCPTQTSYSTLKLTNTGNIAEAGYFMMIIGFILGLLGAIVGLMSRGKASRSGTAIALSIIAALLAVAAVGFFAALLPGAIGQDTPNHAGTGPWSSFSGSTTANLYGITGASWTWGPAVGWYLGIVAFVILLIGAILILVFRKDSLPAPAPAPSATGTAATPPPASP